MTRLIRRLIPQPRILKLFFFVGFVWAAIVGPFSSVLIIKDIGASSPQIGVFTAVCAVISMVFQPVWGLLSDKINSPRRVLCLCLGVSGFFFGCVLLTDSLYIAASLMILDTIFRCSIVSLLDSHTLFEINLIPGLQYSHIRLAGSVFYGGMSLIYSGVINALGVMSIIPISLCIAGLAICWGLFMAKGTWEKARDQEKSIHKIKSGLKKEAFSLIKNKNYLLLILFVAFNALAAQPLFVFIIEYVTEIGGSPGDVPMIHFLRCAVELPFFILIGFFGKNFGAKKLMRAGLCFSLIFITGLLFVDTFFWYAICHLFGAPGFILGLSGRMRYINEALPEAVRSTSITLMGACEIGLGSIAGNLIAGFMIGSYGTKALTLVSLAAILISFFLLFFISVKKTEI